MQCYQCDAQARAVCRFCGSGLCREHTRAARSVSGIATWGERGWGSLPGEWTDYVVVPNAIWCGRCDVQVYRNR